MAISGKGPKIRIQQPDTVPDDAYVAHFDELSEPAKQRLFALVTAGDEVGRLELTTATELVQYDLVKFTDYYSIDFA